MLTIGTARTRRARIGVVVLASCLAATIAVAQAPRPSPAPSGDMRWGGDPEGGYPYVEADPADPTKVVGFDVDVATLIATGLGLRPQFVSVQFTSIDASVKRGDFVIGLSGLEDTPARRATLAVTVPYYEFREVLTVREADRARLRTLADLRGRRVATLGGTIAYEILLKAESEFGIVAVSYDDDVHPYSDLVIGRVDAVLLDHVLADKAMRREHGLVTEPDTVAVGYYVGVLDRGNAPLRDRIDTILVGAMRDGRLEAVFRKWGIWNADQPALYARIIREVEAAPGASGTPAAATGAAPDGAQPPALDDGMGAVIRYLPALFRAALITIVLSCLAMALAVGVGVLVASGRVYGGRVTRGLLTAYVELTRGTPVLLQLYVLYYGLAEVVRLPAFLAALLGLGLNYAAYESEIYRSALEAVPKGQLEAARVLGLTERQVFVLVRGPQALRLALAPMTNDFVALLKDSSLVSVLTVVELTKQTSIFAANIGSWVVPGALCAVLYLAMSLPLSKVARRMEQKWKAATS
ncbi:MAG: ABC transporter substrate-binding protein/permease [Acidobacteria bacterium]|nr:ABC transporter substrate-binding protein/permease [Acidobacteriota bacterium]